MGLSAAEELLLRITGDATGGTAALNSIEGSVQKVSGTLKQSAIEGGSAEEQFQRLTSTVKTAAIEALGPFGIAGAAVVGVMGAMVFQAIEAGSALNDFSEITSITVEHASALQFAGKVAGASLQDLGNLIFNTQKRMAENPEEFERGLKRIGLSIKDVKDLDGDQMFLKIASAFRENTDQTNRAATATELWSRQGRDAIPLLMKPLEELTEKARTLGHVMSSEDAAAAEELTMKWNELKAGMSWMITDTGIGILHFLQDLKSGLDQVMFFDPVASENERAISVQRLVGELPKVRDITKDLIPPTVDLTMKQWESDLVAKQLTESTNKSITANQKAIDTLREYLSAGTSYESLLAKIGNTTYEGIAYDHERGISVETLASVYKVSKTQINQVIGLEADAAKNLKAHLDNMAESEKEGAEGAAAVAKGFASGQNVLQALSVQLGNTQIAGRQFNTEVLGLMPDLSDEAARHLRSLTDTIGDDLLGALERIPQTLANAFTGGGGLLGGLESIGTQVGASLGEHIGKAVSMLGKFGGPIGSAIGGLAGPLIGLLGNIGGPSQQELQGRGAEKQFEGQFGSFDAMMKAVGAAYESTGRGAQQAQADVKALMEAEKQGGTAVQTMIAKINGAFTEQTQKTADVATGVQSIVSAAQIFGGVVPNEFKGAIEKLSEMKGITDDEKKALLGLTKDVEPNFQQLEGVASKYGITLEQLGPKFEQAHIDATAKTIFDDFTALTQAGGNVDGVLHGMSKSVNQLVLDSLTFGTAIPQNMQPLIQKLIDSGDLVDKDGKKLTDTSKITFEDTPISKSLSNLNTTIQKLVDLLAGKDNSVTKAIGDVAAAAAAKIPKNPFEDWHVPDLNFDMPAIPMAAGGMGRVTRPTLFAAALNGPEDFAFSGEGKSFRGMGGPQVVVNVDASGSMFRDRASLNELAQMVGDAINDKLRMNRQLGLRTA